MTILDTEEKPGTWFKMPGGGKVQLRILTPADWKAIRKATIKNEPFVHEETGKAPVVLNHEIPDTDLQIEMVNDLAIVAWEDLLDKNKKQIPCDLENKNKLMTMKSPVFRDFVNAKMAVLAKAEAAQVKAIEKNLSTSQSGDAA